MKWRARGRYDVASSEIEDRSEVEVDDSRPLDMCTVDEAVEKIGFGVFQVIAMSFTGLVWVSVFEIPNYNVNTKPCSGMSYKDF